MGKTTRSSAIRAVRVIVQVLEVSQDVLKIGVAEGPLGELRHSTEAVADLEPHQECGQSFVIQRRPHAGGAAHVALVAVFHEHALAFGQARVDPQLRIGDFVWPPGIGAADDQRRRQHVTIFDKNNELITHLGDNPNQRQWANNGVKPQDLKPGVFCTPHGATWDHLGNAYIVEWLPYGRISKLRRVSA